MRIASLIAAFLSILSVSPLPGTASQAGQLAKLPGKAVNWTHFRFDKKHTGFQPLETTLSQDNIGSAGLLWKDSLGGTDSFVYFSSPAVVNGVVYIGTDDGHLFAYSADGCGGEFCDTPLWVSTYIPQVIDSPAVANGIVYVGSQTDYTDNDGKLNAFAADGCGQAQCAPLWQGDAGTETIEESSPAVWKGLVFVGSYDGKLYAFNAEGCGKKHCKPVWTGQTGGHIESSPLPYKGIVYIGSDDGKLYAFKATGCAGSNPCKPLWTGNLGGPADDSSPAVSNGVVYIGSPTALSAFDAQGCGAKTCAPLWQGVLPEAYYFFDGSPAIAHGRVYIPAGAETYGVAVYSANGCGRATCDRLWMLEGSGEQAGISSSPTIANGVVYVGRNTGEVLAWADPCGEQECGQIWTGQTAPGAIVNSSPTVVNGKIYIGSADQVADGILYVYGLPQ